MKWFFNAAAMLALFTGIGYADECGCASSYNNYVQSGGGDECCAPVCCPAVAATPTFFGPPPDRQYLIPATCGGLQLSGWVNGGFIGNSHSPNSRYNGPYNSIDRSNDLMLNQLYFVAEKGLPTDGSMGLGARADLIYGHDYLLAQSIGWERNRDGSSRWNSSEFNGLAIPQAYVQMGNCNGNIKLGHFYSPIGYEGLPAINNFFYSRSYSYQFAGPFTHWGALGQLNLTDNLAVTGGLTNGWDAIDRLANRIGTIAGLRYNSDIGMSQFMITTGDDPQNLAALPGVGNGFTNRTRYSLIQTVNLGGRAQYVFHHWLGTQEAGSPDGGNALWTGIDQYLYYTIDDCWRGALRLEWFRDDDGTRVGLNRNGNPHNPPFVGNFWSLSAGLNYLPYSNLMFRPEVRTDWFDGTAGQRPFGNSNKNYQLMAGIDAIWMF